MMMIKITQTGFFILSTCLLLFLQDFLIFWQNKVFQVHIVFSQPWNQSFLQEALVIFGGECCLEIKIWALGMGMATGPPLLLHFVTSRQQ
jgi:hypothetical protein